jgi:ABC-type Fe3+/spermidine/putrescine transport system ATPase subunit
MIGGFEKPDQGEIIVNGVRRQRSPPYERYDQSPFFSVTRFSRI